MSWQKQALWYRKPGCNGSGRSARRAERGQGPQGISRPFILRNIPHYDVLSEENLLASKKTADRILAEIGIEFRDDPDTLDHWKRAGAEVNRRARCVSSLACCARSEDRAGRIHPACSQSRAFGPDRQQERGLSPAYGSPFVMDLDQGRRYGTIEDFRNFVKLAQASPWLHHSGRHDLRAGGRARQQAPSRTWSSATSNIPTRGFMGSVTAEETGRGFHRHGAHPVRARFRRG